MENLLSRLARNPYAPIDGASVTRVDELGNGSDDWGNLIAPKYTAPEQTWGETALGVATAPARIATALAGSLSPYGQDGWQVPPIVSEGADALTAVGDAYTGKMAPEDINSRALGMAGFMMGGGGLAARPAGGTGMFAGRLAKTADHEALARAERMAAEGADRNAIWNETGWFQGPDQKWRFEIDDSQANMQKSMSDVVQASSEPPPFSSVFRHDELIGAYPDAADVMFLANQGYKPGTGAMGRFSNPSPYEGKDVFVAGYNAKDIGSSDVGAMRLMPHEMQHFIQSQEGFARGGSPSEVSPQEIAMERARQASIPSRNSWTEIDTTNPENPDSFFAHKFYNRLAGEVEARNAQKRHDMTADQRRATPPWETQDIPDADQIVRLYSNASKEASVPAILAGQEAAPVRGYHGGTTRNWRTGEPYTELSSANGPWSAFYSTSPDVANKFASMYSEGNGVFPVDISFKNPLMLDAAGKRAKDLQFTADGKLDFSKVAKDGSISKDADGFAEMFPWSQDFKNAILSPEHDGVVIRNTADEGDIYIPTSRGTVRSATSGETLFSNSDNSASVPAIAGALDMSQEARLARARDMGFDTQNPVYRGMDRAPDNNEYRTADGSLGQGVYTSPNPAHAAKFGDVNELYLRGNYVNLADVPDDVVSRPWYRDWLGLDGTVGRRAADWARENGYDGLSQPGYQTIVFDPKNIRSVNAAFDPAKSDSANLLAANADSRPALLAGALGQEQDIPDWLLPFLGK